MNNIKSHFGVPHAALIASMGMLLLTGCVPLGFDSSATNYRDGTEVKNSVGPNGELISPEGCPDWTASPLTTFSNAKQGNFGCATTTNLGLMLENPRDLERGASNGNITPDVQRSSDAIKNLRNSLANPANNTNAAPVSVTTTSGQ